MCVCVCVCVEREVANYQMDGALGWDARIGGVLKPAMEQTQPHFKRRRIDAGPAFSAEPAAQRADLHGGARVSSRIELSLVPWATDSSAISFVRRSGNNSLPTVHFLDPLHWPSEDPWLAAVMAGLDERPRRGTCVLSLVPVAPA